jgi:hypothetical protein
MGGGIKSLIMAKIINLCIERKTLETRFFANQMLHAGYGWNILSGRQAASGCIGFYGLSG